LLKFGQHAQTLVNAGDYSPFLLWVEVSEKSSTRKKNETRSSPTGHAVEKQSGGFGSTVRACSQFSIVILVGAVNPRHGRLLMATPGDM
jgi:hypothetical protein